MLELRAGKNRIFIKAVSLILAQVFLVAGLAYPNDFSCLRSPVMFGGKTDRAIQAEEDFHHSSLNDYFGILAGDTGRSQAEGFVEANPNAWVMFGDMSGIRLMNTIYHPEVLDVLIPMSVAIIRDFLENNKYKGLVTRIGLKGDEICLALSSKHTSEQADNIRQKAQEIVANSITGQFWVCKVKISKDAKPLDIDNIALHSLISGEAKEGFGGDMLSGFYRDEDGVFMLFKANPGESLEGTAGNNVELLNKRIVESGITVDIDKNMRIYGLLSPRVLFGATKFSGNLEEAEHRAEAILNITKQNGIEGGTEGILGNINIPKRGEFKTSEGDRANAIRAMMAEEISDVKVYPYDFEPAYLALRQSHLAPVLENVMPLVLSQAMVRPTHQPVLLGLLDCRYQPYGEAWASLEGKEDFNTQEKRAKGLRGQVDDLFGETVAFKYFNDALEGGHNLGNKVLEKEAKAMLGVIKTLERHNIILFRGPPDNWYFVFLGPSGQDFSEDPELMKKFVDDISDAFDNAFQELGLQVKARLRMNIVSSQENMRGPFTIINQVKRIARSRNQSSVETLITNRGAGANQVRSYNTKKREALNTELGMIRAEERGRAIGFLTEKIMKQIKERAGRNALTPNDHATMRIMEQSGWLASNTTAIIDIPDHPDSNFIGNFYIWYGEKKEFKEAEIYAQQEGAKPIIMMPYKGLADNGNDMFDRAAEHFADQFGPLVFPKGKIHASTRAVGVALQQLHLSGTIAIDAGTGGGELASILAMSGARVIAVDNNPDAIEVAKYNARLNGLEDNIIFYCNNAEDLKSDITGPVKLLVMNFPPKQTGAVLARLLDNYPMVEDVVFSGGIIGGTELPYDAQAALEKHGFIVTKQFLAGTVMDDRVWTAYIAHKTGNAKEKTEVDDRPVRQGLLHESYVKYSMAVKNIVNPDNEEKVGVYGGAGMDVTNFLLSTNAPKAYFVSFYSELSVNDLKEFFLNPKAYFSKGQPQEDFDDFCSKYSERKFNLGWAIGPYMTSKEKMLAALWLELRAIGVDIAKVDVISDEGSPCIKFKWAYKGASLKSCSITFIDADITKTEEYPPLLSYALRQKIDIYYQHGGEHIPYRYIESNNFINLIYDNMKPGGYFMTDDCALATAGDSRTIFTDLSRNFPIKLPEIPVAYNKVIEDTIARLRISKGFKAAGEYNSPDRYYGRRVIVRQKPLTSNNELAGAVSQPIPIEVLENGAIRSAL